MPRRSGIVAPKRHSGSPTVSANFMLEKLPVKPMTPMEWQMKMTSAWSDQLLRIDMTDLSPLQSALLRLDYSYFPTGNEIGLASYMDDDIRMAYARIGGGLADFQRQLWERMDMLASVDGVSLVANNTATRIKGGVGASTLICGPLCMQLRKMPIGLQQFLGRMHVHETAPEVTEDGYVRDRAISMTQLPMVIASVPYPLNPIQYGYSILKGIDELCMTDPRNSIVVTGDGLHIRRTLFQKEKAKPRSSRCMKTYLLEQLVLMNVGTLVFYDFRSVHLYSEHLIDFCELLRDAKLLGINVVLVATPAIAFVEGGGTFFDLFGGLAYQVNAHDDEGASELARNYFELMELPGPVPLDCVHIVTQLGGQTGLIERAFGELARRIIEGGEKPDVAAKNALKSAEGQNETWLSLRSYLDAGREVSSDVLTSWADYLTLTDLGWL